MYKIIACDVDETLLTMDNRITDENKEAILKASQKGVKFVLASGRAYIHCQELLKEIGLYNKDEEYLISFNGGAITQNKGNKILYKQGLTYQKAKTIFERGLRYPELCMLIFTQDRAYVYNLNESEKEFNDGKKIQLELIEEPNIEALKNETIIKILYMHLDENYLERIHKECEDIIDDIEISFSSNRYMEFNSKGVSKGEGLKKLAEILNVPIEETIAIGDNNNDLSMIKVAGLGVGVKNSKEEIFKYCDYITEATNDQSAVAEVINKFVLEE